MAKNTKNGVVDINAEEQKLLAQLAALKEKKAAVEKARLDKIAETVRGFPEMLGVATLGDVINFIKQVEKGTLGKVDATVGRTYTRLTDAQRATVKERLAKGEQVSVIADSMGLQYGTVYAIKKGEAAAPVAETVAAPVAAS